MKQIRSWLTVVGLLQAGMIAIAADSPSAQSPYVREGDIGAQAAQQQTARRGIFDPIPISDWAGERFIFLPQPKSLQHFGYQSFNVGGAISEPARYEKFVGRIARVTGVRQRGPLWDVDFQMEGTNEALTATAYGNSVVGIARVADIDSARARWLGKTLWYTKSKLSTFREVGDNEEFGDVEIGRFAPVKVVNIVAGWYWHKPVRFILQSDSGAEGYQDVNLSGTNAGEILVDNSRFDEFFMTDDPRILHKWGKRTWAAIRAEKVLVGMTAEQARFSWGKPDEVNVTITGGARHEQWVYGGRSYLYFDDGVLTAIQK